MGETRRDSKLKSQLTEKIQKYHTNINNKECTRGRERESFTHKRVFTTKHPPGQQPAWSLNTIKWRPSPHGTQQNIGSVPGRLLWLSLQLCSPETMENRDKTKLGKLIFSNKEQWCRDAHSGGGSSTSAVSLSLQAQCRSSLFAAECQPAAPAIFLAFKMRVFYTTL